MGVYAVPRIGVLSGARGGRPGGLGASVNTGVPSASQRMPTVPVASTSIGASCGNGLNSWISKPKSRR